MNGKEILLNDTIGFIRDLPPELIAAFRSTLEDSIESDLLLHVVDASDSWRDEKIALVNQTLEQIHATQPRCIIFNKVDVLSESEIIKLRDTYEKLSPIFVSTISGYGIDDLKRALWDATKSSLLSLVSR